MKTRGTLALIIATATVGGVSASQAQGLPPPIYGPPVYEAQGAYRMGTPLPDDGALLPQEIVGILRSTGYSPLAMPVRRGRFFEVAVVHPGGEGGRVTMDALSGRFIRFVPNDPYGYTGAYRPYGSPSLRPPAPLPRVSARGSALPLPNAKPSTGLGVKPGEPMALSPPTTTDAAIAANRAADARSAEVKSEPVEIKPIFGVPSGPPLKPTQRMPPMQTLE